MTELTEEELAFLQGCFDLARDGDLQLAHLVDEGLPVNLTNAKGDTLLILAAYHQHDALVSALLARGADTERVNDNGQTALASACFRRNAEIVSSLLRAGADPATGERSALAICEFFALPEMLELLRAAPAPPTPR